MSVDLVITIVIGLILVFFLLDGLRRGFVRQVFEIIGLIAAFVAAYHLGNLLADRVQGSTRISHPVVIFFFAAIVFVGVALIFHFIGAALQKIVSVTVLNPVDRLGGAALGVVKGVLVVSLVCVIIFAVPTAGGLQRRLEHNRAAAAMRPVLPRVYHFFIKRAADRVGPGTVVEVRSPRETA